MHPFISEPGCSKGFTQKKIIQIWLSDFSTKDHIIQLTFILVVQRKTEQNPLYGGTDF